MTWKINLLTTTLEQISELIRVICAYIQIWHNEGVKKKANTNVTTGFARKRKLTNFMICGMKMPSIFSVLWSHKTSYYIWEFLQILSSFSQMIYRRKWWHIHKAKTLSCCMLLLQRKKEKKKEKCFTTERGQ